MDVETTLFDMDNMAYDEGVTGIVKLLGRG